MSIYLYSPVCPVRSGQYLNYRSNSVKRMERESYENRISSREYRDFSFLMGERLKKSTHLHLLSHQRINICFAISSAHKFTPVCFSISLVYPVPVSSRMSIHKYDSPHYLYSPISTSLVNYVYQDLLTDCVELD